MRRTAFLALIIVAASAVLVSAGCSKKSGERKGREVAERQMEKALNQGGASQSKVDLGSKGEVDLSGFPGDLRCPGTVPMAHISGSGQDKKGDTYIFQAESSVADVAAFYKKSLASWKQVGSMERPQLVTMGFESQDGAKHVSVMIGTEQNTGKTNLSVTLTGE